MDKSNMGSWLQSWREVRQQVGGVDAASGTAATNAFCTAMGRPCQTLCHSSMLFVMFGAVAQRCAAFVCTPKAIFCCLAIVFKLSALLPQGGGI